MGKRYRIASPASTSNLGTGFDALGLALGLNVEIELEADAPGGFHVEIHGEGKGILPEDHRNWILKSAKELAGDAIHRASWVIRSEVPVTRGLGSSGAASAAGLAAGYLLRDGALPPRHDIFEAVVRHENHPDNAAATVFGGFRIGNRTPGGVWQTSPGVLGAEFRVLLVVPDHPVSTPQARAILPSKFSRSAVVRNTQGLATLLSGLTRGDWDAVRRGVANSIHEPYRLPLVPGLASALAHLRAHPDIGGAYLSGAGPVLAAFLPDPTSTADVALEAIDLLAQQGTSASTRIVEVARDGLRVEAS